MGRLFCGRAELYDTMSVRSRLPSSFVANVISWHDGRLKSKRPLTPGWSGFTSPSTRYSAGTLPLSSQQAVYGRSELNGVLMPFFTLML